MGDEAEALISQALGELDEFDEVAYWMGVRLDRLERGLHTMADGKTIPVKTMKESHLRNSINYGERNSNEYWVEAIPVFEAELTRRGLAR